MSKKPSLGGPLDRKHSKWVTTTVAIWMAAPLQYLLITVKVGALEKFSFSDIHNPKSVC